MIRINLLGKKKETRAPFGLDELLQKLGIGPDEFQELRPGLVRLAAAGVGLYVASSFFTYIHDERLHSLEADQAKVSAKAQELQKELATKKDIRAQMEQVTKDEVELQRQLSAVRALQQGRTVAFSTLNDVVSQLVKGKVWLEDFKYEKGKVVLNGRAWEYFPMNDFAKAITESTSYSNVFYKDITAEEVAKPVAGVPEQLQKVKRFALEFALKEAE